MNVLPLLRKSYLHQHITGNILAFTVAGLVFICARSAKSTPFSTIGFDADTAAQQTAISDGRSIGVAFGNPALLADVAPQVHLGAVLTVPHLQVRLAAKPFGTDVPISIYDSDLGTAAVRDRSLPTVELARLRRDSEVRSAEGRVVAGFVHDFGLPNLRLAIVTITPIAGGSEAANISTHYVDEREANFDNRLRFMRFGEWERVISFLASAGVRVHPRIAIGFGTELAAAARARLNVYIPDASVQDYAQSNLETQLSLRWRPILGITARVRDDLTLGATFRTESAFKVDGESAVTLWNYHEPGTGKTIPKRTVQVFPNIFGWQPLEIAVGATLKKGPISARIGATYQRWSTYVDEHGQAPEEIAAATAKAGSNDAATYRFRDRVVVQGGVTLRYHPGFEAILGLGYHPSPVPPQTGRSNFVDGDLLAVSLGHRVDLAVGSRKLGITATFQWFKMAERTVYKDSSRIVDEMPDTVRGLKTARPMPEAAGLQTNNPGFPGYTSSGSLYTFQLALTHEY